MYYLFLFILLLGEPIAEVKLGPIPETLCREQVKSITLVMPEQFKDGDGKVLASCVKVETI